MVGYILAGGFVITSVYAAIVSNRKKKRLKREREELERQKLHELHQKQKSDLQEVLMSVADFNNAHLDFCSGTMYRSGYEIFEFQARYEGLFTSVSGREYKHLPDFEKEIQVLNSFLADFSVIEKAVKAKNKSFVDAEFELCKDLLSDVEGKSLDDQQRKAVFINEDNNLIVAGAGSGKTTTIAGKVKYLTQRLNVPPQEILLISFTRKSADEMAERIQSSMKIPLSVKTFHKLGLDIIAECRNEKPSIFSLQHKEILELLASFIASSKSDGRYFEKLLYFLSYYLKPYKDIHSFASDAEHNNYLKEQKLEGFKIVEKKTAEGTIIKYRERFKSQEEVLIANFLFRNNIRYEYEEKYQYKTASKKFGQYKPDFYLPDNNIYIEHFGVDENGQAPDWFKGSAEKSAQQRYSEGMEWKRAEHLVNGTVLIETYSWEQKKGQLLTNLEQKLEEKGVSLQPMSNQEFWKYIEDNAPEDIDVFTQLVNTFLVLFKSNNEKIAALEKRAKKELNERALLFLELFVPIQNSYESYLSESREIDFSDMINAATDLVVANDYRSPYQYIIIDEFQDISQSRYQLIRALLDQKPSTRLFCVGDDWQSIYRFAGSDIGIFTGFSDYFKPSSLAGFSRSTSTSYIEYTYRFHNKLIELSSNFILKNPNQIAKSLKSHKQTNDKPVFIHKYPDGDRDGKHAGPALENALEQIAGKATASCSVLLLGRYEFDRKIVENSPAFTKRYNKAENITDYVYDNRSSCKINFLTVHSSKGLEADYVVILNGNSGTYGFPSEISDDPLLNFLLSKADQFPNGEERRLFYVALTRAKKEVHILASNEFCSKFVAEIESNETVTSLKCDWCDNGKLVERKGPFSYFYACNNNHYCNYTRKIVADDFYVKAQHLATNKDYDAAISYFEKTVEVDEKNLKAIYEIGRCYSNKKEYAKAVEYYNRAVSAGDVGTDTIFWRGLAFLSLQRYNQAIADLVSVYEKKAYEDQINFFLSFAYFKASHIIKALEHLNKELEINPSNKNTIRLRENYTPQIRERFTSREVKVGTDDLGTIKGYIELAINHDINIKFEYHKSLHFDGGLKSLRTIKPHEFKNIGDSLCISGYCYMRNEDRTFNVDRIKNLVLNPDKVEFWSEN